MIKTLNNINFIPQSRAILWQELCFFHLEGAYQTSFHHAIKAVELLPNNISCKEYLLFLKSTT